MPAYNARKSGRTVAYSLEDVFFPFHSIRHLRSVCNEADNRTAWRELGVLAALNAYQMAIYGSLVMASYNF